MLFPSMTFRDGEEPQCWAISAFSRGSSQLHSFVSTRMRDELDTFLISSHFTRHRRRRACAGPYKLSAWRKRASERARRGQRKKRTDLYPLVPASSALLFMFSRCSRSKVIDRYRSTADETRDCVCCSSASIYTSRAFRVFIYWSLLGSLNRIRIAP